MLESDVRLLHTGTAGISEAEIAGTIVRGQLQLTHFILIYSNLLITDYQQFCFFFQSNLGHLVSE